MKWLCLEGYGETVEIGREDLTVSSKRTTLGATSKEIISNRNQSYNITI